MLNESTEISETRALIEGVLGMLSLVVLAFVAMGFCAMFPGM